MFLRYVLGQRGLTIESLNVAPLVIASWSGGTTRRLASTSGAALAENWPYRGVFDLYTGLVGGARVSFATFPMGAPATVAMLEELIAVGARLVVGLGLAGSLQPYAPVGSLLLPAECIREEGTSLHYLPADKPVHPDPGLKEALSRAVARQGLVLHSGLHWTTDAIYREFDWKIDQYRARGVIGVDMETSALYAAGLHHGVPVANLLVVSDELFRDWKPAFGTTPFRQGLDQAVRAVLETVEELAAGSGEHHG